MNLSGYLFPRVRLVSRFALRGIALGAIGVLLVVLSGETVAFASRKVFSVAALAFGFALLGWSGSVFAGEAVESMNERLGSKSNWTEADSRRAMTVIGSTGAGWMIGASVMTLVLRAAY
ncbi:DUF7268 family protein [Haladaptatus caseinilyticus]|uniref:DUF7268 family protein n=1 Tax=Haladaptatus caseinilyticus TaxID=2993314 RepID=UPI00224B387C|nr:hypothetical protein [Haladaptatus caseinilyticus]